MVYRAEVVRRETKLSNESMQESCKQNGEKIQLNEKAMLRWYAVKE